MHYEIDFLPVGEGESSGDAITLRYSNDEGKTWTVGVIDAGTKDSGESMCEHIRKYYKTDIVDFLISTHPDQDHASGLSCIIEELKVKKVLMHCPWDYAEIIKDYIKDESISVKRIRDLLVDGIPYAYNIYDLAQQKNIPIHHSFVEFNDKHGITPIHIVSPGVGFYLEQVIQFECLVELFEERKAESKLSQVLESLYKASASTIRMIKESWHKELLIDPEDNATTARNNSSTVIMFNPDNKWILFTSDAGVPALTEAYVNITKIKDVSQPYTLVQVPHHGSRRNCGPTILNKLIGPSLPEGTAASFTALISASKDGAPKHPNKKVVNAFIRRGANVITTQGSATCHSTPPVDRDNWTTAKPLPFNQEVEED